MNKFQITESFEFALRCVKVARVLDGLSADLTALDGAGVLALPAVEVGEQAGPPHVVSLSVALSLI